MRLDEILNYLNNDNLYVYDIHNYYNKNMDNGFKISLQGKTPSDAIYLISILYEYLKDKEISYKVATKKRFDLVNDPEINSEQAFKAMTVYIPNEYDVLDICRDIQSLLIDYTGWEGVNDPTSYTKFSNGIYHRNDRDENGHYIAAN